MPHFGKLLQSLRDQRGLTQSQLADRAGASLNTIQRGEASATCPWRKRLATEVFDALSRRAAISQDDTLTYFTLAGMTPPTPEQPTPRQARIEHAQRTLALLGPNPETLVAFTWIERLIDEAGSARVLAAIEGLALGWGVDLPARAQTPSLTDLRALKAMRLDASTPGIAADIYTPLPKEPPRTTRKPSRRSA